MCFQDVSSEVEVKYALYQCYTHLKQTKEAIAIVSMNLGCKLLQRFFDNKNSNNSRNRLVIKMLF